MFASLIASLTRSLAHIPFPRSICHGFALKDLKSCDAKHLVNGPIVRKFCDWETDVDRLFSHFVRVCWFSTKHIVISGLTPSFGSRHLVWERNMDFAWSSNMIGWIHHAIQGLASYEKK